jgi:hypothetical protein
MLSKQCVQVSVLQVRVLNASIPTCTQNRLLNPGLTRFLDQMVPVLISTTFPQQLLIIQNPESTFESKQQTFTPTPFLDTFNLLSSTA